ncbi:MAG: YfhO family protein [Clostridia bacterium]|nr:YfhO family protein [Clostridia bacterium]
MDKQNQNQNEVTSVDQETKKGNSFVQKFRNAQDRFLASSFGAKLNTHFNTHGYLYFSFLVPALLFFFVFILQGTYPFGNGSVLVLDLNGQYVYFFEALRKAIYGDASLLYSWFGTLGSEFVGSYAYYLASPLSYLVALFPATAMTEFLLVLELIKCGLCGLTMAYYLRKTRPLANEMITISIAVMYALSSFAIVMAHNTMWLDALILLPLITYGIERLINYGHFKLFIISFALALLANFYIGYMLCYYVFLYFFYYYFFGSNRQSNDYVSVEDGNNNFIGEKNHFVKSLFRIGVSSLIAIFIACVIILPTAYSLSLGKTEFSETDWSFAFKFNPLDFISKLFIGSYDTVRREGLPFIYCGMFTLILVPVYFISKRVSKRQKVGAGLILGAFFLIMCISPLDLVMHGFQEPNWLNYRYSFVFSFLLLVFAHRGLELLHTIRFQKTVIIASVWAALVLIASFFTRDGLFATSDDSAEFWRRQLLFILIPIVALVVYEVGHYLLLNDRFKKVSRASMLSTLAVVICVEMFVGTLLNTTALNDDVIFSPKYTKADGSGLEGYDNYLDKYRVMVDAVQKTDDSFYRMEKNDLRKYDDNFAFAMRGTTGSTSTLNAKTIKFLNRLGYISQSNISSNKGATSVANTLLGIKYYITTTNQDTSGENSYYLTAYPVDMEGVDGITNMYLYADGLAIYSYLNEYALSLAYASSGNLKNFNITESNSPFTTMNKLITAILGEKETVEVFKEIPYDFSYDGNTTQYKFKDNYSETVYDIYGDPIIKLDENGNKMYDEKGNPVYEKSKPSPLYHEFTQINQDGEKMVIDFTFTMPEGVDETTEVLFKFPTRYNRQCTWTFKTEGSEEKTGSCFVDDDKTDCILSLGKVPAGQTGTLSITVTGKDFYLSCDDGNGIFYYVDKEVYKDTMTTLAEGNFEIEEYTESYFKGKINATEGRTSVFTSIPYEEHWKVKVDGKEVETYMTCAALVGFDLGSEGEHTIEIEYRSAPLRNGLIFTGIGLVLFIGWIVVDTVFFRKKRLANATLDYTCLSEGDYQSDEYDDELAKKRKVQRMQEQMRLKKQMWKNKRK